MEPTHVEVRCRKASDGDSSKPFTTWPLDDLNRLVTLVNQWGNPIDADVTGQFSYEGDSFYFELVFNDGD